LLTPTRVTSYTKNYPLQVPIIEIEKIEGLSEQQIEKLADVLGKKVPPIHLFATLDCFQAKELVGEEMAFELVELARDFVLHHNTQTLSFYEEMVLNRKKEQREAFAREQRIVQEEQERKRKEG
jgi:hypothetical protein